MTIRNLISAAAIAAMPFAAQAATLVVPAAGTGPGANNSQWQSELTLHTAAPRPVGITLSFVQGTTTHGPADITLQARQTISITDVVRSYFNITGGTGTVLINVADRDARSLAVSSRTFNVSEAGEFGQDIPAIATTDAIRAGEIGAIHGPSAARNYRFNFGVYTLEATEIEWQVLRANGTILTSKTVSYAAGEHAQYNGGVTTLIGVESLNNDTIHARVKSGSAVVYGSIINNATGDPTYVPGIRVVDNVNITFAGVDLDEDGDVDVADANGDGLLDGSIDIITSLFARYFNVLASSELGDAVTYELVSSPAETHIIDGNTVRVAAGGDVKGKTGEIRVKATTGTSSSVLTIPVRFK